VKFSPMKRDIILVLIKDTEMANIIDNIKLYLNITNEQVFHTLDYLINIRMIEFQEGKLILTMQGYEILRSSNLLEFSLFNLEKYKYKIDESYLKDYIPKNF